MPTTARFDDVLEHLHSPDEGLREQAARQLAKLGRVGLTPEQGVKAFKASTMPYPARRNGRADTSVDLIRGHWPFPSRNTCRRSCSATDSGTSALKLKRCGDSREFKTSAPRFPLSRYWSSTLARAV